MKWTERDDFTGAEIAADKLLRRFGIVDPSRVELEDLAYALGITVTEGPLEGAEAWLVRHGNKGIIRVREDTSDPGRRRFSISHELGHWTLQKHGSQLKTCLTSDIHAYQGSRAELEASAFAGFLLLPTRLLRERYGGTPALNLICSIASDLATSVTATAVRLIEVTDDPCLVVFGDTETREVRWWRRSKKCAQVWLESKQALSDRSIAGDILQGNDPPGAAEQVDADAWFEHIEGHQDFIVYEETMRLGRYSTFVTLLFVEAEGY